MRYSGGAWALAVLSFTSSVFAQSSTDADTATETDTDTPTATSTAEPADQTCPYTPVWNPCIKNTKYDCATFLVPEDWSDDDRGERPLHLIRIPATNEDGSRLSTYADSIVINPGGPGGSGISAILEDDGYYARSGPHLQDSENLALMIGQSCWA